MAGNDIRNSGEPITQERLSAAVTAVLPGILEKLRPHYEPARPLDDFERDVMKYTEERNQREHLDFHDMQWSGKLREQAAGLSQSLYTGEDAFLQHLADWHAADRTGCSPLSYGSLNYHLSEALIDELSLRGTISQLTARRGGRSHA